MKDITPVWIFVVVVPVVVAISIIAFRTRWSLRGGGKQPLRIVIDILAAIEASLADRLDFVELSTERVRVQRHVARWQQDRDQRVQQAFELAAMLVQKLGLPPIG